MNEQDYLRDTNTSNIFSADVLVDLGKLPAGATEVDLTGAVPRSKLILGGIVSNLKNDLAGGSTTYQLTVGSKELTAAKSATELKGSATGSWLPDDVYVPKATDKTLVKIVAGDATPGGTLVASIIYI